MGSNPKVSGAINRAPGERVNPGVWRDIEGRFRALRKEHGDGLMANWISTSWNEHGEQWYLSGSTNDRERELFTWLAERATVELGHPGGNTALASWLDLLKTESPNFKTGTILTHRNSDGTTTEAQGGTIHRLIEASADYCLRLETKGILKARSPRQGPEEKPTVQNQKRPDLTEDQHQRIDAAERELAQMLAAHEQMRKVVDPGEWQPIGPHRVGHTLAGELRKLERDLQKAAIDVLGVLAEASWHVGSVEVFRSRVETHTRQILEWVLAKVNPKDLPVLDRAAIETAIHEEGSIWITKAQREFPPPWLVDQGLTQRYAEASRPLGGDHAELAPGRSKDPKASPETKATGTMDRGGTSDRMFALEAPTSSMDRVLQTDPVWIIRGTQKTSIPITRLNGEVVWVNAPDNDEPDDALLTPEEEMRITEETLKGRSELRSELETVFAGPAWPLPSAVIDPFRRHAVKIFDVNAAGYRSAVSKQAKDANEVLDAFINNLLSGIFGTEWEKSPGDKVVRIEWQCGTDGRKGREIPVFAGNDPDPRCLYHQLIGDAIKYRYRFHAPLPEPIPGEPPGINLSGEEWSRYIGLKERHNLAMAIKPYLEDRKAHWQFVYNSPIENRAGTGAQKTWESSPAIEIPDCDSGSASVGLNDDALVRAPDPVRPRRTPDLKSSRERLALVATLARELAFIKQEVKGYCTVDSLKRKHPKFALWSHIEDSQIKALVDGEEFTPKAYAESLTLIAFGLTSRETLKKDRRKLRRAKEAGKQKP